MALSDYIPNVFGQAAPSYLQGLLGAEETQNLQNRANVQGLLGAGLALAQGMSRTGPRRSAAENILGSLGGGFNAAGGAYQQGVNNYVTQQQIAQTQLAQQDALLKRQQTQDRLAQIKAIEKEDPALARLLMIDPAEGAKQLALKQQLSGFKGQEKVKTPASLRAQAQAVYASGNTGLKSFGDSLIQEADRLEVEQAGRGNAPAVSTTAPQQQTTQGPKPGIIVTANGNDAGYGIPNTAAGERYKFPEQQTPVDQQTGERVLPAMTVTAQQGPDAQLLATKNDLIARNRALFGIPTKDSRDERKANEESISKIDEQLKQISSATFNWVNIEKEVPEKFKAQIRNLKTLADTGYLGLDQIRLGVQDVYKQVQESEKVSKIDGLPGIYAQQKFGITDQTKLKPEQLADVLRFADAPTADQYAQLAREAQRTQFETGTRPPVPAPRNQLINSRSQVPVVNTNVVPTTTTTTAPTTTTTTATTTAPKVTTTTAQTTAPNAARTVTPAPQPRASTAVDQNLAKNPLISRPDSEVPPKKKQELIAAQPGLIGATNYTVKNIVDARNVAKSLLDNPKYLDALSGRTAPLRAKTVGGIVLDQDAYSANEILNNLLGRSFISEIQEMRANSPTGGAVGNVAVAEMNTLSKIRAALTLGMDRAELKKQLESYVANANRAMKRIPNDYALTYGYNGEFDEIFASEVVKPAAGDGNLPSGVRVRAR